jgi:hypothetical protein
MTAKHFRQKKRALNLGAKRRLFFRTKISGEKNIFRASPKNFRHQKSADEKIFATRNPATRTEKDARLAYPNYILIP